MTEKQSSRSHSVFVLRHSFVIRHSSFFSFVISSLLPQTHPRDAKDPPPALSAPGCRAHAPENFGPCRRAGRTEKLRPRRKYKLLRSLEDSPAWTENSDRASA